MTHSWTIFKFQFGKTLFSFCSALHENVLNMTTFLIQACHVILPNMRLFYRCAMSLSTCPPMLIIHSININPEASSVENISLFIRAVNKPSRREEKAPKGAYNKEELRQIETRGTANETMTLSHL